MIVALPLARPPGASRPLQVPADISETEVRAYEKLLVDRLNLITLEADLYTGIKSKQEATHD